MSDISVKEILQVAIDIEQKGMRFYHLLADSTDREDPKGVFLYLATEEEKHLDIFVHMLSSLKDLEPLDGYPDDFFHYLKDYYRESIFDSGSLGDQLIKDSDFKGALNFALQKELDSISFYQQLKDFVPTDFHGVINRIIDEERQHFTKLSEVKSIFFDS